MIISTQSLPKSQASPFRWFGFLFLLLMWQVMWSTTFASYLNIKPYGSGHVHGILWNGQELISFERDSLHRETTRTQANTVTQNKQYDAVGRLKAQVIAQAGQTLNQRAYDYDAAGQLTHISDNRRGELAYRYDPVGRLLQANSALGEELFAFDPAGNISDSATNAAHQSSEPNAVGWALPTDADNQSKTNQILDNLLKQYVGTHYSYDALGNMTERLHNGVKTTFEWDSNNRMIASETNGTRTTYTYDPLGRRIAKTTGAQITIYGWDGDTLAFEQTETNGATQTTHTIYEANSFIPMVQVVKRTAKVLATADGEDEPSDGFNTETIAYYQNDHLGTPQELTGSNGNVVWSANYKAWGEAKAAIDKAAQAAGIDNKLRFQGQYLDEETGLHYNRHRYYDPHSGRFVSQDPIKLAGGNNLQVYAPNPTMWVDPLGLCTCLALPAPRNSEPWMPNTPITSSPVPAGGMNVEMAMSPGQTRPGGWATTDNITDVGYVRNQLAVTPEFKPNVSHVQTFHISEGVQLQHGTVGPQTFGSTTYAGGGSQVQILNFSDRAKLTPVGEPRPIY